MRLGICSRTHLQRLPGFDCATEKEKSCSSPPVNKRRRKTTKPQLETGSVSAAGANLAFDVAFLAKYAHTSFGRRKQTRPEEKKARACAVPVASHTAAKERKQRHSECSLLSGFFPRRGQTTQSSAHANVRLPSALTRNYKFGNQTTRMRDAPCRSSAPFFFLLSFFSYCWTLPGENSGTFPFFGSTPGSPHGFPKAGCACACLLAARAWFSCSRATLSFSGEGEASIRARLLISSAFLSRVQLPFWHVRGASQEIFHSLSRGGRSLDDASTRKKETARGKGSKLRRLITTLARGDR